MVDDAKSSRQKALKKEEYQRSDKDVKSSLRKDKREWANNIAQEALTNCSNWRGITLMPTAAR